MEKLQEFIYRGLHFKCVGNNLYQTERFGDKLVYEYKENEYHKIKDERISCDFIFNKTCPSCRSTFNGTECFNCGFDATEIDIW